VIQAVCHVETSHGGSLEHLRASAAEVSKIMEGRPKDAVVLPLTKEKTIYCGTCHLYHDPLVLDEKWLASGWVPPKAGLAGAVRTGVLDRWAGLAKAYDQSGDVGSFATDGRTNNGDMPKFMHALTDSERDAMARYLSGL